MGRALLLVPPLEVLISEKDLTLLSPDSSPHEMLGRPCFSKLYQQGIRVYWSQSLLISTNNPVISSLTETVVSGDGILEINTDVLPLHDAYDVLLRRHCHRRTAVGSHVSSQQQQHHQWEAIPAEILAHIILLSGTSAASKIAATMSQVCCSWRHSLAQERILWQSLAFQKIWRAPTMLSGHSSILVKIRTSNAKQSTLLPFVLRQAIEAGNISAAVIAARFYEEYGDIDQARKYWMKAARLQHPEAQWKIGTAYYNADLGLHQDPEECALWLTRSAKTLMNSLSSSMEHHCNTLEMTPTAGAAAHHGTILGMSSSVTNSNSRSVSSASEMDDDASSDSTITKMQENHASLPLLMTTSMCRFILSQTAHILGVIYLDGDSATKQDSAVAIKWFQIAQENGCSEASRILQSLFRSGQYG